MSSRKIKKICGFLCVCIFFPVGTAAQVVITEIMYDVEGTDTGREWVEVQNTGDSAIDFSTWKLFEANTNHKITAVGDSYLPAGAFAVIADNPDKFKADNPQFSGLLFDSVFSLSNDGETLVLRDSAGADSDSVSYSPAVGGAGDGTTLQKTSTGWISAPATIGSATTATESTQSTIKAPSANDSTVQDETDKKADIVDTLSTHSSQSVAFISHDKEELQVTAGRPRLGFVGSPLSFEGKIIKVRDAGSGSLQNTWSLGDGTQATGERITHTYQFPGDYIVVLNASFDQLSAVTKIKVKIIEPDIALDIGGDKFVQITNNSSFELNVGDWILESADKRFILPKDTLIAKKSSVKIALTQSGLYPLKKYIRLADPSGKILATVYSYSENKSDMVILLPPGMDEASFMRKIKEML